jgi:hypothetical protein
MEVDFCIAALEEAIERFGVPEIFNSDRLIRRFRVVSEP